MIRTILVSSRAAIRSNEKLGRRDLAVESARRGLAMLEALGPRLQDEIPAAVIDQYESARTELMAIAEPPEG